MKIDLQSPKSVDLAIHHVAEEPRPVEKVHQVEQEVMEVVERVEENVERSFRVLRPKQVLVAVGLFAVLGLIALAPASFSRLVNTAHAIQGDVTTLATTGFNDFNSATDSAKAQDYAMAVTQFKTAEQSFTDAREQLNETSQGLIHLSRILPGIGGQPASVDALLQIGEHVAGAGTAVSQGAELLSSIDLSALRQNDSVGITSALVALHATLRTAQDHLSIATLASQEVQPEKLPDSVQEQVRSMLTKLPQAKADMDALVQAVEIALGVMGNDGPKRYLVLFQNNREMRPTGGFLGSFALVDMDKGVVKKITVPGGGIYDVAGQLGERVQSPKPLELVNPYWNIQDANWWPDFPTSAEKVKSFWGKAGGPSVDGVITLTPTVVEDLLRITGPIDLTETYGTIITADNFYETVQLASEAKYDETTQSKKILADLTPILFNQLFNLKGDQLFQGMAALRTALDQKDILLSVDDPILEREIQAAGWGGELRPTTGDYLMVVDTNIGGGKTDGVIDETISHHTHIDDQGKIIDTVQVTRHHRGVLGDELTGVNNQDYMRIYVPKGSTLISAQGFSEPDPTKIQAPEPGTPLDQDLIAISGEVLREEATGMRISQEFGKTVFANWVETTPGTSTSVTVSYQLPFALNDWRGWFKPQEQYSLLVQKQPGSFDPYVALSMDLPDTMAVIRESVEGAASSVGFVLETDHAVSVDVAKR